MDYNFEFIGKLTSNLLNSFYIAPEMSFEEPCVDGFKGDIKFIIGDSSRINLKTHMVIWEILSSDLHISLSSKVTKQ